MKGIVCRRMSKKKAMSMLKNTSMQFHWLQLQSFVPNSCRDFVFFNLLKFKKFHMLNDEKNKTRKDLLLNFDVSLELRA